MLQCQSLLIHNCGLSCRVKAHCPLVQQGGAHHSFLLRLLIWIKAISRFQRMSTGWLFYLCSKGFSFMQLSDILSCYFKLSSTACLLYEWLGLVFVSSPFIALKLMLHSRDLFQSIVLIQCYIQECSHISCPTLTITEMQEADATMTKDLPPWSCGISLHLLECSVHLCLNRLHLSCHTDLANMSLKSIPSETVKLWFLIANQCHD